MRMCVALVLSLLGSAGSSSDQEGPKTAALVRRPDLSGFRFNSKFVSPEHLVVKDAASWGSVWRSIAGNVSPLPPTPPVDFAQEMVVVVAMGQRNTGGFIIDIVDAVAGKDGDLQVDVRETSPGTGCGVTTAMTAPVDVAI